MGGGGEEKRGRPIGLPELASEDKSKERAEDEVARWGVVSPEWSEECLNVSFFDVGERNVDIGGERSEDLEGERGDDLVGERSEDLVGESRADLVGERSEDLVGEMSEDLGE